MVSHLIGIYQQGYSENFINLFLCGPVWKRTDHMLHFYFYPDTHNRLYSAFLPYSCKGCIPTCTLEEYLFFLNFTILYLNVFWKNFIKQLQTYRKVKSWISRSFFFSQEVYESKVLIWCFITLNYVSIYFLLKDIQLHHYSYPSQEMNINVLLLFLLNRHYSNIFPVMSLWPKDPV